jgi:hypothetical protein
VKNRDGGRFKVCRRVRFWHEHRDNMGPGTQGDKKYRFWAHSQSAGRWVTIERQENVANSTGVMFDIPWAGSAASDSGCESTGCASRDCPTADAFLNG